MEIPNVPKPVVKKPEDTGRIDVARQKRVPVTEKPATQSDEVSLSGKAKLMANLRTQFDKLDSDRENRVKELKEKVAEGTLKMSSEDIVSAILKGTLFSAV